MRLSGVLFSVFGRRLYVDQGKGGGGGEDKDEDRRSAGEQKYPGLDGVARFWKAKTRVESEPYGPICEK